MKTKFMTAALAAAAAAVATSAQAEIDMTHSVPGYVYYNRPGADIETHERELTSCVAAAARTAQPIDMRMYAAVGGVVGGAVSGVMTGVQANSGSVTNIENCMVVRGWRVVQLPEAEGEALYKLGPVELAERLAPLVGAENPQGQIMRVWGNDLARPDIRIFTYAGDLDKLPLSLKAWSGRTDAPAKEPAAAPVKLPKMPKTARPPKPLAASALSAVPEDSAVVIVRITGPNLHRGQTLAFVRPDPTEGVPAWVADQRPNVFATSLKGSLVTAVGAPLDSTAAFVIPAGHWRLGAIGEETFSVGLCLGSPGFDVKAGDVLFAGTFDLNAAHVGPDLALAPAKAFLKSKPELAERVQPVAYINGETAPCAGQWIYALEVKDAPFKDGYAWGGAAAQASQSGGATP